MKNVLKIITVLTLSLFLFQGCNELDNSRFGSQPTTGWVEFQGSGSTTISLLTTQLELPLEINVPIYQNGLNISYTLEAVQGDFSQIVTTGSNIFVDPADDLRQASVVLDFANLDQLTDVVVFDVVLTGVDVTGVNVGVDENSVTTFRVSTPCPIVVSSTYTGTSNGDTGYTVNLTDLGDNTYSIDTSWGLLWVDTLCGGCLGGTPSYPDDYVTLGGVHWFWNFLYVVRNKRIHRCMQLQIVVHGIWLIQSHDQEHITINYVERSLNVTVTEMVVSYAASFSLTRSRVVTVRFDLNNQ